MDKSDKAELKKLGKSGFVKREKADIKEATKGKASGGKKSCKKCGKAKCKC